MINLHIKKQVTADHQQTGRTLFPSSVCYRYSLLFWGEYSQMFFFNESTQMFDITSDAHCSGYVRVPNLLDAQAEVEQAVWQVGLSVGSLHLDSEAAETVAQLCGGAAQDVLLQL